MRAIKRGMAALSKASGRRYLAALLLALVGGVLAGCGGSGLGAIGGSTYAGDIEPTVGRAQRDEVAELPSYAAPPPEDGDAPTLLAALEAAEGEGEDGPVAEDSAAQSATDPDATAPVASAVVQPPVVPAPAQVASEPPAVVQPAPSQPAPPVRTPAPPPAAQAPEAETARVVPDPSAREPRPETYPNLADVPEDPGNLPSDDETAAVRAELEADRDAISRGETPPSVSDGSILGDIRERLREGTVSPSAGRTASVTFDAGATSLNLTALATLQTVAATQAQTGGEIRLVGYAYASSDANRQAALGIALDRANTVGRALVSYGVDPSAISVFANVLSDVSEQNAARSRRVDIGIQ